MMLAIWVLNQGGRSQGGLQVVEKVGGPSQSKFQGGGQSGESEEAKNVGKGEEDTGLWEWQLLLVERWFNTETMGKHFVKELFEEDLQARMNKVKVQEELKWTGEETNFVETVNS